MSDRSFISATTFPLGSITLTKSLARKPLATHRQQLDAKKFMKAKLAFGIFAATLVSVGLSLTPAPLPSPWLAASGQWRGDILEVWVNYDEHRTPRWNPEKDHWPMSSNEALALARGALQKLSEPIMSISAASISA